MSRSGLDSAGLRPSSFASWPLPLLPEPAETVKVPRVRFLDVGDCTDDEEELSELLLLDNSFEPAEGGQRLRSSAVTSLRARSIEAMMPASLSSWS